MRFVAGLDGGGTKTAVKVADEQGNVVHELTLGSLNYNGQDEETIRRTIRNVFENIAGAIGGLERCAHVCIGAAGISNPTVASRLETSVRACGYEGALTITGDHETALVGALDGGFGMILIAGTGSICHGRNAAGETHRTGGFGYLIDDEGSGYSIGRDLLSALVRAGDGRIPPTPITELVYAQLGMDKVRQVIGFVYDPKTGKKEIAALAPLLTEACKMGDAAALGIARKNAASLAELVAPAAERLSLQRGNLAIAGSVLLGNPYVQSAFLEALSNLYPEMNVFPAKKDAAGGAVLMALERLHHSSPK
ncbi:N-acetylglucosamine kinase [Cohnella candidum]|uniref:ATPase n=1 Tax=Cohnella candidum TaxID=2674991 RepID=A0A3G3JWN9_9BACL|nr:BadF/BadG/BcrA/BcrD ATPase family protein [Cohnella candidum]AYQ72625.1 ATPase [Cohnella candidum]